MRSAVRVGGFWGCVAPMQRHVGEDGVVERGTVVWFKGVVDWMEARRGERCVQTRMGWGEGVQPRQTHRGLVEGGPQPDAGVEGAEHEGRPLHKQRDVGFALEAAQVLEPRGVREVVQRHVGLQPQLLHHVQHLVEPVRCVHAGMPVALLGTAQAFALASR